MAYRGQVGCKLDAEQPRRGPAGFDWQPAGPCCLMLHWPPAHGHRVAPLLRVPTLCASLQRSPAAIARRAEHPRQNCRGAACEQGGPMWSSAPTDTEQPTLYSLLQLGSITVRCEEDSAWARWPAALQAAAAQIWGVECQSAVRASPGMARAASKLTPRVDSAACSATAGARCTPHCQPPQSPFASASPLPARRLPPRRSRRSFASWR